MIDGIGWAGKVGCRCAGCTAAVFSELEKSRDRERVLARERERERGRTEKRREGRRTRRESKPTFLLPFRQTRCLQLHAESYHRTWHGCSKQVLLIVLPFPKEGRN